MGKQLMKNCDELRDKTGEYDKTILELLKRGHREIIINVIKDYLSLTE